MAQNFVEPQIVKGILAAQNRSTKGFHWQCYSSGPKFYCLRNILHDWVNESCVAIVQNLILALAPEPCILIEKTL
jgi:hypothetical protein